MIDPVLEADEVQKLDRPRLLDVRELSAFEASPIEGARWVPVDTWIEAARSPDASFGNLDYWQSQIAALGLSDQDTAVIFDDGRMIEAARVWVVLQFFGAKAAVVNGGCASGNRHSSPPALKRSNSATMQGCDQRARNIAMVRVALAHQLRQCVFHPREVRHACTHIGQPMGG